MVPLLEDFIKEENTRKKNATHQQQPRSNNEIKKFCCFCARPQLM